MKRKIPCFCDNTFTVEVPEEINLDADPRYVEDILAGHFMNFTCGSCGKKHKPEFPIIVKWPSRGRLIEVLPELDRGAFYLRKEEKGRNKSLETVISYPELAERIALIKDGLSTGVVEALKYYLFVKADESCPEGELSVWYNTKTGDDLEFHIHGIKDNEVAVMRVPAAVYEKTLGDYKKNHRAEPFASLQVKSYCSIQNMLRPDELK
ncbi:MAG: CpXC domain-containing protein [Treponema sp.]|jgi:hypothetical protein|nr:CpXC domain-containing protein [Treponema sp.]